MNKPALSPPPRPLGPSSFTSSLEDFRKAISDLSDNLTAITLSVEWLRQLRAKPGAEMNFDELEAMAEIVIALASATEKNIIFQRMHTSLREGNEVLWALHRTSNGSA